MATATAPETNPVLTAALKAPAPRVVKAAATVAATDVTVAAAVVAVAVNAKAARSANVSALTESRCQPMLPMCRAPWQQRAAAQSHALIGPPALNDQSAQSAQNAATVLAGAVSAKTVNAPTLCPHTVRTPLAHRNP